MNLGILSNWTLLQTMSSRECNPHSLPSAVGAQLELVAIRFGGVPQLFVERHTNIRLRGRRGCTRGATARAGPTGQHRLDEEIKMYRWQTADASATNTPWGSSLSTCRCASDIKRTSSHLHTWQECQGDTVKKHGWPPVDLRGG